MENTKSLPGFSTEKNSRKGRIEIADVMQSERTQHQIEAFLRKIDVLDRGAAIFDAGAAIYLGGALQHLLRKIDADDMRRPLLCRITAMPAETAAEVEDRLVFQRRQHGTQFMPFARLPQPLQRARHGAVALEKPRIVVNILLHRRLSGTPATMCGASHQSHE